MGDHQSALTDALVLGLSQGEPTRFGEIADRHFAEIHGYFATVKEGFLGRHLTFVPLGEIQIGPEDLQVPVTEEHVRTAPEIEMHGEELTQADESPPF